MPKSSSNPKTAAKPIQSNPAAPQPQAVPVPAKPKRKTSPATDKATLALVQTDYINGQFKTIRELASRYGMHENTLLWRAKKENWEDLRLLKIKELQDRVGEKAQSIGETYLKNTFARMKRYEKLIDVSQDNLGARDTDGNPLLDPDAINSYTLSEQRINAIAMAALRIPAISSTDVTSKGQSVGDSIVSALERLRSNGSKPVVITEEQIEQIADYEVVPDSEIPRLDNSK